MREGPRHACAFPSSPLKTAFREITCSYPPDSDKSQHVSDRQDGFSRGICGPVVHKAAIQLQAATVILVMSLSDVGSFVVVLSTQD